MTPPLHPAPRWRHAIGAHLHAVGLAARPSLVAVGAGGLALAALGALDSLRTGRGVPLVPEVAIAVALAALLWPVTVWKGENGLRRSYLATLPLDRRRHALAKVAAGWAWLVAATGVALLGMLALALATGGAVGVDELRVLARDVPRGALPTDLDALARRWTTPRWQWAVPFTGATVAYLFGSAVVLARPRVRRWLAALGVGATVAFVLTTAEYGAGGLGGAGEGLARTLEAVVLGRYGLASLFATTNATTLTTAVGEVTLWGDPPTLGVWALASLLWLGLAAASVLAAVWTDGRG